MKSFNNNLVESVNKKKSFLIVGLDPNPEKISEYCKKVRTNCCRIINSTFSKLALTCYGYSN